MTDAPAVGEYSRVSLRTVFGGPEIAMETAGEIRRLRAALGQAGWQYDIDLLVRINGSVTPLTDPSGLYHPRVSVPKRTVTGNVLVASDALERESSTAVAVRSTIRAALHEIVARIASRDSGFDEPAERARVAALDVL